MKDNHNKYQLTDSDSYSNYNWWPVLNRARCYVPYPAWTNLDWSAPTWLDWLLFLKQPELKLINFQSPSSITQTQVMVLPTENQKIYYLSPQQEKNLDSLINFFQAAQDELRLAGVPKNKKDLHNFLVSLNKEQINWLDHEDSYLNFYSQQKLNWVREIKNQTQDIKLEILYWSDLLKHGGLWPVLGKYGIEPQVKLIQPKLLGWC